jgi:hypothetical protein
MKVDQAAASARSISTKGKGAELTDATFQLAALG